MIIHHDNKQGDNVMEELKLISWNVNGIRAAVRQGFLNWFLRESPSILCLQEVKASPEVLDATIRTPKDYVTHWNYPARKGYSGVVTFSKYQPQKIHTSFGAEKLDLEGRVIISVYPKHTLFNIYFPNGKRNQARLQYKMDFYNNFLEYIEPLRKKGQKLIICGDFNTAHKEIDIARPKENSRFSGFLPMERAWIDKFVSLGYIDTFRYFNKEPNQYTWWDLKTGARQRNIGWRIDYFFVTENLISSVTKAYIMPEVFGSDHCPIGIDLIID